MATWKRILLRAAGFGAGFSISSFLSLKEGLISSVNSVNRSQALRSVSASPAFANSLSSASRHFHFLSSCFATTETPGRIVNLRYLPRLLSLRPPCFHHRRQLLPHGCTHRLATSAFLRGGLSLLRCRLAIPFRPALFHRRRDALARCRAHATTFLPEHRCCLFRFRGTTIAGW